MSHFLDLLFSGINHSSSLPPARNIPADFDQGKFGTCVCNAVATFIHQVVWIKYGLTTTQSDISAILVHAAGEAAAHRGFQVSDLIDIINDDSRNVFFWTRTQGRGSAPPYTFRVQILCTESTDFEKLKMQQCTLKRSCAVIVINSGSGDHGDHAVASFQVNEDNQLMAINSWGADILGRPKEIEVDEFNYISHCLMDLVIETLHGENNEPIPIPAVKDMRLTIYRLPPTASMVLEGCYFNIINVKSGQLIDHYGAKHKGYICAAADRRLKGTYEEHQWRFVKACDSAEPLYNIVNKRSGQLLDNYARGDSYLMAASADVPSSNKCHLWSIGLFEGRRAVIQNAATGGLLDHYYHKYEGYICVAKHSRDSPWSNIEEHQWRLRPVD